MKKILLFLMTLLVGLILFMPKVYLWYGLLKWLEPHDLYITSEQTNEKFLTLELDKNKLFKQNREIADIKKLTFTPFILYNKIEAEGIKYESIMIEKASCTQSILEPFVCRLSGVGEFGELEGSLNLRTHEVSIDVLAKKRFSKKLSKIKDMNKSEKGYHYESVY